MKHCKNCGRLIPSGRLEALPGTEVCILCSDVKPLTAVDVDVDSSEVNLTEDRYAPDFSAGKDMR